MAKKRARVGASRRKVGGRKFRARRRDGGRRADARGGSKSATQGARLEVRRPTGGLGE